MRIKTFFTASDQRGEWNELGSETVPDQSLSIKEILARCESGLMELPVPYVDGYDRLDPDDVLEDISDISDLYNESVFLENSVRTARSPRNSGSTDSDHLAPSEEASGKESENT